MRLAALFICLVFFTALPAAKSKNHVASASAPVHGSDTDSDGLRDRDDPHPTDPTKKHPKIIFVVYVDDGHKEFTLKLAELFLEFDRRFISGVIVDLIPDTEYALSKYSTDKIEALSQRWMSTDDIVRLSELGFEVASHTRSHNLPLFPKAVLEVHSKEALLLEIKPGPTYTNIIINNADNWVKNVSLNGASTTLSNLFRKQGLKVEVNALEGLLPETGVSMKHLSRQLFEFTKNGGRAPILLKGGAPFHIMYRDIFESRKALTSLVDEEVITFVYPYGGLSATAINMVQDAGYCFARAVYDYDDTKWNGSNPFKMLADDYSGLTLTQFSKSRYLLPKNSGIDGFLSTGDVAELRAFLKRNGGFGEPLIVNIMEHYGSYSIDTYRSLLLEADSNPEVAVMTNKQIDSIYRICE